MLIDNNSFHLYFNLLYAITGYLAVLSSFSNEFKKDILTQNALSQYLTFPVIILLSILIGFRAYDVGTDTGNYYYSLWQQRPEIELNGEFLFPLIAIILQYFQLNFTYFLFLIAILFFYFLYKALKNYTQLYQANILMALFSSMSFFFFLSLSINVIRQGVSLAILLYAYTLIEKKSSTIKIILLCVLSLAFHQTSIIPILVYGLSYIISKKGNKIIIPMILLYFLAVGLALANFGFLNVAPFLADLLGGDRRTGYISGENYDYTVGFKPQFVAFNTFFLILSVYTLKRLNDKKLKTSYLRLVIYFVITSILLFLAFQLPFSDRWGLFSWISIPFLVTPLFYSPFVNGKIKIHFVLAMFLIFLGFQFYAS